MLQSLLELPTMKYAPSWCESNTSILPISTERKIDGRMFDSLSREDIATIFPQPDKFVLGMNLYKVVQKVRACNSPSQTQVDTCQLLKIWKMTLNKIIF